MVFKLPELSYDFDALEPVIDAKTMEIHYTKHHQGYVNKLNLALEKYPDLMKKDVDKILIDINKVPSEIRQAVINNAGGHSNHSFFWKILIRNGKESKRKKEIIEKKFGDFEGFKMKFKESAMTRFGSGWCWLVINKNEELEIVSTANQDSPLMLGLKPIFGLDVWEHAYYLKYQNRRDEYIDNFWKIVNWEKVEENYEKGISQEY